MKTTFASHNTPAPVHKTPLTVEQLLRKSFPTVYALTDSKPVPVSTFVLSYDKVAWSQYQTRPDRQ